jgi:hypothetical protein
MADLSITVASVVPTSVSYLPTRNAGATVTAGQGVYLDSTTTTYKLAQSDGTAAEADAVGIAMHGALSGQPLLVAGQGSTLNIGATTTKATTYVVSATAGGVAPQADLVSTNKIVRLGYAVDAAGAFVVDIRNTGVSVT